MNTPFALGALLAIVMMGLTGYVLWRQLASATPAAVAPVAPIAGLRTRLAQLKALVLRVRALFGNAWPERYRQSWVLIAGEPGAGKSSVAQSYLAQRRVLEGPPPSLPWLAPPSAQMLASSAGVLVDPAAGLTVVGADGRLPAAWHALLQGLAQLRPERALDGLLLVVSARSLLTNDAAARHALGWAAHAQLESLRVDLGLRLPVYLVITQCDAVPGFSAYWGAAAARDPRHAQIVGWSSPGGVDPPMARDLVTAAFSELRARMRALQLAAAAQPAQIALANDFLLHPNALGRLRAALDDYLSQALRSAGWQAPFACRGLYFVGAPPLTVATPGQAPPGRTDLAFVDDLLATKVLREQGLAQVTRPARQAHARFIRWLKLGSVLSIALLVTGVGVSAWQLAKRQEALQNELALLAAEPMPPSPAPGACPSRDTVQRALARAAALSESNRSAWMPVSLLFARQAPEVTEAVRRRLWGATLAAALQCRSEELAIAVTVEAGRAVAEGSPDALLAELRARAERAAAARRVLDDWAELAGSSPSSPRRVVLLRRLLEASYGVSWTPRAWPAQDALVHALGDVSDRAAAERAHATRDNMLQLVSAPLPGLARQLQQAYVTRVSAGGRLLGVLQTATDTLAAEAQDFSRWLDEVRGQWLPFDPQRNPCAQAAAALLPALDALRIDGGVQQHVDATLAALALPANCAEPAQRALLATTWPNRMPLVIQEKAGTQFNPALAGEAHGFAMLKTLGFMRPALLQDFDCQREATGWQATEVEQALAMTREYQQFREPASAASMGVGDAPLYDRVARRVLERSLGDVLRRAQSAATAVPPTGGFDASGLLWPEPLLRQQSVALTQVQTSLFTVREQMRQLGMTGSAGRISQCLRSWAQDGLQRVSQLATASRLWLPDAPTSITGSPVLAGPAASSRVATIDYLTRQRARVQVLAGYAEPFVVLLRNSSAINDGQSNNDQSLAYWTATLTELSRYNDSKDPTSHLAQLELLILDGLPQIAPDNCAAKLAALPATAEGNDLFLDRRRGLMLLAKARCSAQAYAAYQTLAQRFNATLAGRFPFAAVDAPDASPFAVRTFFAEYADIAQPLQQGLRASSDVRAPEVLAFLAQLDQVAALLRPTLLAGESGQPIRLTPQFRANRGGSVGAEQIVQWNMSSGMQKVSWPGAGVQIIDWIWGGDLAIEMTWASGSAWRPVPANDGSSPQATDISGSTVRFGASGTWALLRLVAAQSPTVPVAASSGPLLEMTVPLARTSGGSGLGKARVYVGLGMSAVDPRNQAQAIVAWPSSFPTEAPDPLAAASASGATPKPAARAVPMPASVARPASTTAVSSPQP